MKLLRYIPLALLLVAVSAVVAHSQVAPQTWDAPQDGGGNALYDVASLQVNNLAGIGTRCVEVDAAGNIMPMTVACNAGTVTNVIGAGGLTCSPSSPNPTCTLVNFTCPANEFASSASAASGLQCSQPTYANIGGSVPAITQLTTDVLAGPGSGSQSATIAGHAVTYAKMQHEGASTLLGNSTASSADIEEIGLGNGLGFTHPGPGVDQVENTSALFMLTAVTPLAFNVGANTLTGPGVVYTGGTSPIDIGTAVGNGIFACSTVAGVCSPAPATVTGGVAYNGATGFLTDAAFSCGANTWVSSTSTSGPACTQPAFSSLSGSATCAQLPALTGVINTSAGSCATAFQNIAAHTIWANGTGLAAPAAQTPIGTTMAFDGTGQLQNVGLRDGGGVNHVTTGTWPISSVIETDVSGNIAAEAQLACGQSEGPWTGDARKSAGSCAVTNVAITETSGPTSLTIGAIPDSAPEATVLIRPAGSPTVVGVAAHNVAIQATKLHFSYTFASSSNVTSCWLTPGGPFANCGTLEYPNDFLAGHIQVRLNINTNGVTAGNLTFFATRNGTGIGGTGINVTSATSTGVHVGTAVVTSSASSNDTYGAAWSTDAGFANNFNIMSLEVILTP